jgi:uncharacterized OB-fold protein
VSDSDEFWAGCDRHELVIQACRSCGRSQHFPRNRCHFCHSTDLESRSSRGVGSLLTWSTVHRAPSPDFADLVPYTLGIVRLQPEGVQLMARIMDPEEDLVLDMPVEVEFVRTPLGPIMPAFRSKRVGTNREA